MPPSNSDIALIELALKGERMAYEELFNRHQNFVYTLAMKFSGNNRALAEEITQDSFLKAFQNLQKFRNESSFSTWLYRITFSTAMDTQKIPKKSITIDYVETLDSNLEDADNDKSNGEMKFENEFIRKEIGNALSQLSPLENTIVTLFYLHGEDLDNISLIVDMNKNLVKVKLFRARQKLKKLLSSSIKPIN